jgi:hypothetical protein
MGYFEKNLFLPKKRAQRVSLAKKRDSSFKIMKNYFVELRSSPYYNDFGALSIIVWDTVGTSLGPGFRAARGQAV